MKYLPEPIFLIIYKYVGHNALYLNKFYYKYLLKRRQEFIEKPLRIKYRLCQWKQKQFDIENNYHRKERASMCVQPYASIDVSGNRRFGKIANSGVITSFTKKIEDSLIPVSTYKHTAYPIPCIVVIYWTIFKLECEDIEKYKRYHELWVY